MKNDSNPQEPKKRGNDAQPDARAHPGTDRLPHHAVDLINRALFEEWLQRYGSWDAFIEAARRKERAEEPGKDGALRKNKH